MASSEILEQCRHWTGVLGLSPTPAQIRHISRYIDLLCEWNKRLNLSALESESDILEHLILESFTCLQAPELEAAMELAIQGPGGQCVMEDMSGLSGGGLVDVGAGAGIPGIPLKIMKPEWPVSLVESMGKRVNFLQLAASEGMGKGLRILHGRAEELAGSVTYPPSGAEPSGTILPPSGAESSGTILPPSGAESSGTILREQYHGAVCRALAPMPVLAELVLPFLKVGGVAICQKGPTGEDDVEAGRKAIEVLGGRIVRVQRAIRPWASARESRSDVFKTLVVIEKVFSTPEQYPRRAGMPKKRPIA